MVTSQGFNIPTNSSAEPLRNILQDVLNPNLMSSAMYKSGIPSLATSMSPIGVHRYPLSKLTEALHFSMLRPPVSGMQYLTNTSLMSIKKQGLIKDEQAFANQISNRTWFVLGQKQDDGIHLGTRVKDDSEILPAFTTADEAAKFLTPGVEVLPFSGGELAQKIPQEWSMSLQGDKSIGTFVMRPAAVAQLRNSDSVVADER